MHDRRSPKQEAADDRDASADVERYEQLRSRAVDGEPSGWRLGLGVVRDRGIAAWLHVSASVTATVARPAPPAATEPVASDALVGVLAQMALSSAGR